MADLIPDVLVLAGAGSIAAGLYLIEPAAILVAVGLFLMLFARRLI